eukprot:TRINITY_DN3550_c0_g1_i5.p1 TRINITY_DN3550_c0_g1~~TRINITY_DN3550_c0_g1_i5.p1  ORF type:complete len:837 (+),score=151.62 TRINITY_DN3550_c0_g1_i5:75-2585(+)
MMRVFLFLVCGVVLLLNDASCSSRPSYPTKNTADCDCQEIAFQPIPTSKKSQKAFFTCIESCLKQESHSEDNLKQVLYQQLGLLYDALGRGDLAVPAYEKAVADFRDDSRLAISYLLLGNHHSSNGQFALAEFHFKTAARMRPESSVPWNNLANVYRGMGRYEDAIDAFEHSLTLQPLSMTYCNIAQLYEEMEMHEIAQENQALCERLRIQEEGSWDKSQAKQASLVDIQLAFSYLKSHDYKRAARALDRASHLSPNDADVEFGLGTLHQSKREYQQAIVHYSRAIDLSTTENPDILSNKASCLHSMGRYSEAIRLFQRAIELSPDDPKHRYGIAATHLSAGNNLKEASLHLSRAVELDPSNTDAYALYVFTLQSLCDWNELPTKTESLLELVQKQLDQHLRSPVTPFHSMMLPMTPETTRMVAESHSSFVNNQAVQSGFESFNRTQQDGFSKERINVGYVSSDFREHPLGYQIQGLFMYHDKSKFQIFCYSTFAGDGSQLRERIKADCDHFRELSYANEVEIATTIAEDDVDILVDLNGWLSGNRHLVFALHPARIQIAAIGYPSTTGSNSIEYILTDQYILEGESTGLTSEFPMVMPISYQITEHRIAYPGVLKASGVDRILLRREYGLPEDSFIFASLNQAVKIDPHTFSIWMEILHQVPNSCLWIYVSEEGPVRDNLLRSAMDRGINRERIIFFSRAEKAVHLQRISIADLALDPFICNSHTTAADALWAELPLLTLRGDRMSSRVAASMLRTIDCRELIVDTVGDYRDQAIRLATDPKHYAMIQEKMSSARASPLFDTKAWVALFEQGLASAWDLHARNESHRRIDIKLGA